MSILSISGEFQAPDARRILIKISNREGCFLHYRDAEPKSDGRGVTAWGSVAQARQICLLYYVPMVGLVSSLVLLAIFLTLFVLSNIFAVPIFARSRTRIIVAVMLRPRGTLAPHVAHADM